MKKSVTQTSRDCRTWVEVDYGAIEKNARSLKGLLSGEVAMMAVVKSNAYGHGMALSAKAALKGGADWLAVDELSEALALRAAGIGAPVLVLGYTLPNLYKIAAAKNVSVTISSLDALKDLSRTKLGKRLRIHLKFDTGLHRQGISGSHVQQAIRVASAPDFPAVIEGAYTHFAVMEDPAQESYSRMQADEFRKAVEQLRAKGFSPITHASASSGILFSKDFHFDVSRAGIALYGLWPSPEIRAHAEKSIRGNGKSGTFTLRPALSWKTLITEVKLVPQGAKIGYDLTHTVPRDSRIAVIPVGYWHGLPRSVSSRGKVLVGGKKAGILGRVSMDMAVIDVTDVPSAKPGDEVGIIGSQKKERVAAEDLAASAGTINYEIVTRINPLVPRIPV